MSKYNNRKIVIDGITFDSTREGKYYRDVLKLKLKAGLISDLRLQVPYELIPAIYETYIQHLKTKDKEKTRCIQKSVKYYADFVYVDNNTGNTVVVDAKGMKTKEYLLKKKMMRAFHGISIVEV